MVRKCNQIISLCYILLLCTPLFAQESNQTQFPENQYTLDELYKIALKRAEKIKIAENNLFIAEKDQDYQVQGSEVPDQIGPQLPVVPALIEPEQDHGRPGHAAGAAQDPARKTRQARA